MKLFSRQLELTEHVALCGLLELASTGYMFIRPVVNNLVSSCENLSPESIVPGVSIDAASACRLSGAQFWLHGASTWRKCPCGWHASRAIASPES